MQTRVLMVLHRPFKKLLPNLDCTEPNWSTNLIVCTYEISCNRGTCNHLDSVGWLIHRSNGSDLSYEMVPTKSHSILLVYSGQGNLASSTCDRKLSLRFVGNYFVPVLYLLLPSECCPSSTVTAFSFALSFQNCSKGCACLLPGSSSTVLTVASGNAEPLVVFRCFAVE